MYKYTSKYKQFVSVYLHLQIVHIYLDVFGYLSCSLQMPVYSELKMFTFFGCISANIYMASVQRTIKSVSAKRIKCPVCNQRYVGWTVHFRSSGVGGREGGNEQSSANWRKLFESLVERARSGTFSLKAEAWSGGLTGVNYQQRSWWIY